MVKRVSQASLKISKDEKKQLNSLIKVLRPKVYITDTSSFKKLVQELTGNGSCSTNTSTSPPPTYKPEAIKETPAVTDIEDHGVPESSLELSDDSTESCNLQTSSVDHDHEHAYFNDETRQAWEDIYFDDQMALENLSANQHVDLLAYQDLESWLLDVEPFPSFSYPQIEQQIGIYDYDLSGLLQS